ncbi:hypothetical protein FLT15_17805 [Paenibacillus thiaminolyticus]|uniref:hypothetical protein n=1 Tax=Paenibacillus thiaminolyticus TaxID=49283 RepID=UPI001164350E|nr:hypothetical protein [Paenibacillus thiaminolyticus]NGP59998.1 hypothetical protein [Paenibacillus thiaminolyticus]NGP60076.1 hypothetical protein [Paenibacillus thiaminolyticus]NGP60113.1 hypothetical protein [Paenibacillus thiaminolyticus]
MQINCELYKPGVKVRHKRLKYYGVGEIMEIAATGKRARVKWQNYDHKEFAWDPYPAYYRLDLLEVVQDA